MDRARRGVALVAGAVVAVLLVAALLLPPLAVWALALSWGSGVLLVGGLYEVWIDDERSPVALAAPLPPPPPRWALAPLTAAEDAPTDSGERGGR